MTSATPPALGPAGYQSRGVIALAHERIGWLLFFLLSLSLTATVMHSFEKILETEIQLAFFVPLLIGHGGNSGGQTVATIVRSLGEGEIGQRDFRRVVFKEAMTGLLTGLLLSAAMVPVVLIMGISFDVVVVIALTIPSLGFFSNAIGAAAPFVIARLGYDPAVIAAPLMTTVVDTLGLLLYFVMAKIVFGLMGVHLGPHRPGHD